MSCPLPHEQKGNQDNHHRHLMPIRTTTLHIHGRYTTDFYLSLQKSSEPHATIVSPFEFQPPWVGLLADFSPAHHQSLCEQF